MDDHDDLNSVLRDRNASIAKRMAAVEQSSDLEWNDDLAKSLLAIVAEPEENEQLRARAAIALGPLLEETEMEGFDEDEAFAQPPITEATFNEIQETLRRVYADEGGSKEVRRRALEGSVRARQDWHADAVRAAYANTDRDWRLTGVFCMQFVANFDEQILEALQSDDPEVHFEAIRAAGAQDLRPAWPHLKALLTERTEKDLLIAAMEAAAYSNPKEAAEVLPEFLHSKDEDIAAAADEAMAIVEMIGDEESDEDEEE